QRGLPGQGDPERLEHDHQEEEREAVMGEEVRHVRASCPSGWIALRSVPAAGPGFPTREAAVSEADGVFQGGGVKGIALVGALIEFAERGWTNWVNVAGTSAGSIIASYLACGHDADDLETLLRQTPYPQFEDFGPGRKL